MKKLLVLSLVSGLAIGATSFQSHAVDVNTVKGTYNVTAEDDLAVRQIIARLNLSVDLSDYTTYASFFSDDALFETAFGRAKGRTEITAALTASAPYISGKRHVPSNIVINGDAKQIVATSYLTVYEATTGLNYLGSAVNVDTMEKRNGKWVVVKHQTYMDKATAAAMQKK